MTSAWPDVGTTFAVTRTFSADAIREFARLVGDGNPLHHDEALAAASRFGGLMASGAHTVSVMMGAIADRMSQHGDNVGLGYSARLRRPVLAGETCTIEWRIAALEPNARLGGLVAKMEGRLVKPNGETAVTATAEALLFEPGSAV